MWKMSQQLSGISTASWNRRRSSSLSWCQVRAAPPALLSQGRALRAFGVPVFSTGHRGEQTSPETCTLSVSAWLLKPKVFWAKKPPYHGHKTSFSALPHPTACPVTDGSRGPAAGEAPSRSSRSQEPLQPLLFAVKGFPDWALRFLSPRALWH